MLNEDMQSSSLAFWFACSALSTDCLHSTEKETPSGWTPPVPKNRHKKNHWTPPSLGRKPPHPTEWTKHKLWSNNAGANLSLILCNRDSLRPFQQPEGTERLLHAILRYLLGHQSVLGKYYALSACIGYSFGKQPLFYFMVSQCLIFIDVFY